MNPPTPSIFISGVTDEAHMSYLLATCERAGRSVTVATLPSVAMRLSLAVACLDLTSYLDQEKWIPACRAFAQRGQTILLREPQLRTEEAVRVVRSLELQCVVLDSTISYDTDPSWITDRIMEVAENVAMTAYVVDLFTDREPSWSAFMSQARSDTLVPADLQAICERFPMLLTADVDDSNVRDIASFPGSCGVFFTCDEARPLYAADRHTQSFEEICGCLQVLLRSAP